MPQPSCLDKENSHLDQGPDHERQGRACFDQARACFDQAQVYFDQARAYFDQAQAHFGQTQTHGTKTQTHDVNGHTHVSKPQANDSTTIDSTTIDSTTKATSHGRRRAQVRDLVSKVPAITLGFWAVKVLATTLGETGGDSLSMSMGLGYLTSTFIFAVVFVGAVALQIRATRFNQWLYWFTIIATTTLGTTIADFVDRSLGVGYFGGTFILVVGLLTSLGLWYHSTGTIAVTSVQTPRTEAFYWLTIMFSQTLGTALGDWTADTIGLEYTGGALLFAAVLAGLAGLYRWTQVSRTLLFWSAFILTRPLGAVVGDFLDKPFSEGGLALDRYAASAVLLMVIVAVLATTRQQAAEVPH
jgi:uncharacterized membrane-anchored protein